MHKSDDSTNPTPTVWIGEEDFSLKRYEGQVSKGFYVRLEWKEGNEYSFAHISKEAGQHDENVTLPENAYTFDTLVYALAKPTLPEKLNLITFSNGEHHKTELNIQKDGGTYTLASADGTKKVSVLINSEGKVIKIARQGFGDVLPDTVFYNVNVPLES